MTGLENRSRRRKVFALGVLIVLTTAVTTLAAFANPPVDESLYREIRRLTLPSSLPELDLLRTAPFVGLVALVGLLGWRCRGFVVWYLLALLVSTPVALGLGFLVGRARPYDSYLTSTDSYPSPAVVALTVVAVMVPVGLWILTGSRVVEVAAALVLWVVVAGAGLVELHDALRWPLDVIGAALIGATAAVAALAVVEQPSRRHARCDDCPWQRGESARVPPAHEHGGMTHPLYRVALLWTVALAAAFGYLAYTRGVPRLPVAGTGLEVPVNIGLVVLMLVGVLLAARWHVVGALVVALAGLLLGYQSSVQYSPLVAVAVTVAAFVPALLLWVQWHRVATVSAALGVAVTTAALLGGMIYVVSAQYGDYWGPTHPSSATPGPATDVVEWMWAGGVTQTRMQVRARTAQDVRRVRLVVGENPELAAPTYSRPKRSDSAHQNVVALTARGLTPDTDYYYALELDGKTYTKRIGHVTTFPRGPASFTFAVSSCSRTGSNGQVFDAIRRVRPLFYLISGNWFYGDIDRNDPERFRGQYTENLSSAAQAALYASAPVAYVWDAHDFAGYDADRTAGSKPAAMAVYRDLVPHYPLRGGRETPIFQAFTVGEVRFVLTDARSARDPSGASPRSMLGPQQLGRLRRELARADRYDLVVWANGTPWVGAADPASDTWAGFASERRTVADAIARNDVDNLLMVGGGAHMLAYDDGTHTDYSRSGNAGFPLFQAGALDRRGSVTGGPYTGPVISGGGQFGTVTVRDDDRVVRVTVTGWDWDGQVRFTRTFAVPGS